MAILNIFCDPTSGGLDQSVRANNAGTVCAGTFGASIAACSAILGGPLTATGTHTVNTDLSVIVMGDTNSIFAGPPPLNGAFSLIGNGNNNQVTGGFSSILNGQNNSISGDFSVIAGGSNNNASPNAFVGGGDGNGATCFAVAGGGQNNSAGADFAAILGGLNNNTIGCASFIGSGDSNTIIGNPFHPNCSSIVGGQLNCIGYAGALSIQSDYSFIGGGFTNSLCARASFLGGGDTNNINQLSDCSFLGGGSGNNIGLVGGGGCGSIFSVIAGGLNNNIDDTAFANSYSAISGGNGNIIAGSASFIGGGSTNCICGVVASVPVSVDCSAIVGGYGNIICNSSGTGGQAAVYSFIGGGTLNTIGVSESFIGGGNSNTICSAVGNTKSNSIVGGSHNNICDDGTCVPGNSFLGGGVGNCIVGNVISSSVIGGDQNCVMNSSFAFIGGGNGNTISSFSNNSFIGSGQGNSLGLGGAGADCSFIGGGFSNCIIGIGSFIGGGGWCNPTGPVFHGNTICGDFSFIGGGSDNFIDNTGAATTYGVIGGGQCNLVCAGTSHSSIFSGYQNKISGSCSSVLGGSGSCDNGFNYVGIFGQNVIGVMNNAFHAEELVLQNIPDGATAYAGLPTGALYYLPVGTGVGSKTVYVK